MSGRGSMEEGRGRASLEGGKGGRALGGPHSRGQGALTLPAGLTAAAIPTAAIPTAAAAAAAARRAAAAGPTAAQRASFARITMPLHSVDGRLGAAASAVRAASCALLQDARQFGAGVLVNQLTTAVLHIPQRDLDALKVGAGTAGGACVRGHTC